MKKWIAFVMAAAMLFSAFAVTAAARGYTLVLPEDLDAHNLEAYGLHTMNVFYTENPPVQDGVIATGEYPGPNNGCTASGTFRDGMWLTTHSSATSFASYVGRDDVGSVVDKADIPPYMNTYLCYDDEYFYIGLTTVIQPPRVVATVNSGTTFQIDTRYNFMQSSHILSNYSANWTRYNISKTAESGVPTTPSSVNLYTYSPTASTYNARTIRQYDQENEKWVFVYLPTAVDNEGKAIDATVYKNNAKYIVEVLEDGRWSITFETREPLVDVLRVTDVEYEDGTPIDFVPEWGAFGWNICMTASSPNTDIYDGQRIFAQTMLPGGGKMWTAANAVISGLTFKNTFNAAATELYGSANTVNHVLCPAHFLGYYDPSVDYDYIYDQPDSTTIAKVTTRVTRTRTPVLTSGVRGVNGRVVAVATSASDRTGDDLSAVLIAAGAVMLLAASAAVVLFMKKRGAIKD